MSNDVTTLRNEYLRNQKIYSYKNIVYKGILNTDNNVVRKVPSAIIISPL